MTEERQAIHAYLSLEAHRGWQRFADEGGVTVSGLLEVLGLELAEEMAEPDGVDSRQPWVRAGRKVDAERRRRGREAQRRPRA